MARPTLLQLLARMFTLIGICAAGSSAQAAIYVGAWDPQFQTAGALQDLGYQGQATFLVPNACLATDGLKLDTDPGCNSSFLTGFAELYRFSVGPGTILATANFGPQVPDPVLRILVAGGEVVGIDTGLIGFQFVTVADSGPIYSGPVWLDFDIGNVDIPGLAYLWTGVCQESANGFFCTPTTKAEIAGRVTFTRVSDSDTYIPEPGTLSLLFGALSAVWLGRRRLTRG